MQGLAHIGVFVADAEASRRYYTEKLGFEDGIRYQMDGDDGPVEIRFVSQGSLVVEFVQDGGAYAEANAASPNHIAIACKDIDAQIAALREKGVEFETEKPIDLMDFGANGCRFIMFRGPDGERLELQEML